MDPKRLDDRVTLLTRRHGVYQKDVAGAYDTRPLRGLEFLFHEVAHWLTLGNPADKTPRRLSPRIDAAMGRIPSTSSDSLEIDASLVTFLAGFRLGLWTDPGPIVRSCRRNLRGPRSLEVDGPVWQEFLARLARDPKHYDKLSAELAKWFRPSAKLLPPDLGVLGV